MKNNSEAYETPLVDLLRNIDKCAWAVIEEPGGWSYHTNIGTLVHRAADRIEELKKPQRHKVKQCHK